MLITAIIKEMKLLSRDLHGVAVLFLMPILFMLIMSATLSQNNEQIDPNIRIALVAPANDILNQQFQHHLQQENLNTQQYTTKQLSTVQAALQNDLLDLVINNPNTSQTLLSKEQPITLWINPSLEHSRLLNIKAILQSQYTQVRLSNYLDTQPPISISNQKLPQSIIQTIEQQINQENHQRQQSIQHYLHQNHWQEQYINRHGNMNQPNSVQHSIPAWLIFGMFFILIPLSNVMATERQTNTLTRLKMAQISAYTLIIAKFLPYFIINQLQFIGMITLGQYILPLLSLPSFELTPPLWSYAILSICISIAALGYGLLISIIAKTTEQAVVLGGGGIIIMAALGGIMVPVYIMPHSMQIIAQFSPMNWGLNAFQQLLLNQHTLHQIQPQLLYLISFGILTLVIASCIYQRQLNTQAHF